MEKCLEIINLNKQYAAVHAVNNVSFSVPVGRIFGLLGPNGAGKTSLIRMITTITVVDSGQILFQGKAIDKDTPGKIGYLPEERGLYKKMKVFDHILYIAQLKGMPKQEALSKINAWLDRFDLQEKANKLVEELSKGMQQKVQFITTIIHEPPLIILDEPFSGLDPINTNLIKDEIYRLKEQGTTVIFSTHRMEQVEEICEEIVLINKGQIILEGTVNEVKDAYKDNLFKIEFEPQEGLPAFEGTTVSSKEGMVLIQAEDEAQSQQYLKNLLQAGVKVLRFEEVLPSLNEIFIKKVKNNG